MKKIIREHVERRPIQVIMILASLVRLLSVIFSKGFGMHDDHFLIIESAQSWIDGHDYESWLPVGGNNVPPGHSYLYSGLHYLLFLLFEYVNLNDPQTKMLIVRFLHGAFSLLTVYFGYKITEIIFDKKNAFTVGMLLSLYWFMPFLSVRNLVEVVCIPLLLYATFVLLKYESTNNNHKTRYLILSGIALGLAFSIRYQTIIFSGGIIITLLYAKKWKSTLLSIIGFIIPLFAIEGGIDLYIWGYPFAEITEYIKYNIENAYGYITLPWYTYILFLSGVLIPPVSIFLLAGYFKSVITLFKPKSQNYNSIMLLFLPSFLFLLFHSIFPNKQERFIITIIPFIIILGIGGWKELFNTDAVLTQKKFFKISRIFFWVLNLLLLTVISTMYSKKARVESMIYLSKYSNIGYFIQEGVCSMPPRFYLKQWTDYKSIDDSLSFEQLKEECMNNSLNKLPKFVLFYDTINIEKRFERMRTVFPSMKYETIIEPGFVDKVLYRMNPKNRNQSISIYRLQ